MPRKLTPRQVAARKARAARGPLSDEARARLREVALARRPWEKSTGPRTAAGKAKARRNAIRGGHKAEATLPPILLRLLAELRAADRGGPLPEHHRVRAVVEVLLSDTKQPPGVHLRALSASSWWNRLLFAELHRLHAEHLAGRLPGW